MWLQPFVVVHVLGTALVVGGLIFLNGFGGTPPAVAGGLAGLAGLVGAAISAFVCRLWPGLSASAWKLWLVAWIANPVVIFSFVVAFPGIGCLTGSGGGWDCIGLIAGALVAGVCAIPPLVGLVVRRLSAGPVGTS